MSNFTISRFAPRPTKSPRNSPENSPKTAQPATKARHDRDTDNLHGPPQSAGNTSNDVEGAETTSKATSNDVKVAERHGREWSIITRYAPHIPVSRITSAQPMGPPDVHNNHCHVHGNRLQTAYKQRAIVVCLKLAVQRGGSCMGARRAAFVVQLDVVLGAARHGVQCMNETSTMVDISYSTCSVL